MSFPPRASRTAYGNTVSAFSHFLARTILLWCALGLGTASAAWQAGPSLNTARNQFAGGVIDGKIYVFGGNTNPNGAHLKSTEMLDPSVGSWVYKADNEDNGGEGVEELSGAVMNGKLYVFGGWGGPDGVFNFVEEYDPATDTWTSKASMPTTRSSATAVTYGSKIYLFGGYLGGDDANVTDVVEAYDPSTNTWESVTNLPVQIASPAVTVVGDTAYVIGGFSYATGEMVDTVYAYDFVSGEWTTSGLTALPSPRVFAYGSAAPVVNGKIYLIGGIEGDPEYSWASDKVDIYDPATDTWETGEALPVGNGAALSVVLDDKIYVVGGDNGSSEDNGIYASVWALDLPTNTESSADLSVAVAESADPVTTGDSLTYTWTITNNGPDAATGVTVDATLNASEGSFAYQFAYASQGPCTDSAIAYNHSFATTYVVSCDLGTLAAGGSATVTLSGTAGGAETLTTDATVTATESDPDTTNNQVTEQTTVQDAAVSDYSVSGSVTAQGRRTSTPLARVRIKLQNENRRTVATATTDRNGQYAFSQLEPGTYYLVPSKRGYGFTPTYQQIVVEDGDLSGVDFSASSRR